MAHKFQFHINIQKCQNLLRNSQSIRMHYQRPFLPFRKYVGIFPPNIMETITDLGDVNGEIRDLQNRMLNLSFNPRWRWSQSLWITILIYGAQTDPWKTLFSRKSILRFIWPNIGRLMFKVAVWLSVHFYGQGTLLVHGSNLCSKLNVTKDLIVVRCMKEL